MKKISVLFLLVFFMIGCGQQFQTQNSGEREMTLGLVQKEIRVGMSQADVVEALGSPNIVTKDSGSKERWVYDRFATEATASSSGGYWTLILFGGGRESYKTSSTQRTLTVIIKFDRNSKVEEVSYHASKF